MIIGAKILFCVISIVSVLVILTVTLVLVRHHSTKPGILSSPAAAPSRLPSGKTEGYKYVLYWNEAYGTKGGQWTRTLFLQM